MTYDESRQLPPILKLGRLAIWNCLTARKTIDGNDPTLTWLIPEEIAAKCQKAQQLASAQGAFKTKHLNLWVGAAAGWMDMSRFNKCADPTLVEDDFIGQQCVVGLDLASKLDLLALAKVFWKEIDGKTHYYAFGTYWTNEARLDSNPQYRGWQIDGLLRVCEGETNDYGIVEDYLKETAATYELLEVAHDPWQAHDTMTRCAQAGLTVVQVPFRFDEAQKRLAKLVEFDVDIYLQPEREACAGQERIPLWIRDYGYSQQGISFLIEKRQKWYSGEKAVHTLAVGDRIAVFSDVSGGGIGVVREINGDEMYYTMFSLNVIFHKKIKEVVWDERNWRWETTGVGSIRKLEQAMGK